MSKMTVAIAIIKEQLDSISGCDGFLADYVEATQKEIEAVINIINSNEEE